MRSLHAPLDEAAALTGRSARSSASLPSALVEAPSSAAPTHSGSSYSARASVEYSQDDAELATHMECQKSIRWHQALAKAAAARSPHTATLYRLLWFNEKVWHHCLSLIHI